MQTYCFMEFRAQKPICPWAQPHAGSNWVANHTAFSNPWWSFPNRDFPQYSHAYNATYSNHPIAIFQGSSNSMDVHACSVSRVPLFATPWTVAHQAPLSVGLFRQKYWSRLPFSFPGDLPDPGIELKSPASLALAGRFFTTEPPGKPVHLINTLKYP